MKRLFGFSVLGATLALSTAALAQTAGSETESRPATATVSGTTGLWYVPTSAILPAKKWSLSFYRTNRDDGQGFTDISTFPATFAVGLGDRAELFGNWALVTRIDRDARPLFFSGTNPDGTGGGVVVDYPLVKKEWIGNKLGDLWLGGKVNLIANSGSPFGTAVRAMVKLPVGDDGEGASTGKTDFVVDGIVSHYSPAADVSGYVGFITRGSPDGFALTNGIRWGVGAGFPQQHSLGLRINAELFGEKYLDDVVTAPAGLFGADLSSVPTSTTVKGPVVTLIGLTWQAPNGFFIGGSASWNVGMKGRDGAGYPSTPKDDKALEIRIGFHPGARGPSPRASVAAPPTRAAEPAVAAAGPAPAAAVAPTAAPQNRLPTVRASCNPCTVEVGRQATVTADAQDPDGDPLTYQWTGTGVFASPTGRQSLWTAPTQAGSVPLTVTVSDGRGGSARDTVTIQVTQPAARQFSFEDVHFEFDRYSLRPDALTILDEAVTAMRANANLRLQIEGHTCNIGTAEYNLALGERRAQAVRDYLRSKGIDPERLSTVSYGEERPQYKTTHARRLGG